MNEHVEGQFDELRQVGEDRPLPMTPLERLQQGQKALRRRNAVRAVVAGTLGCVVLAGGFAVAAGLTERRTVGVAETPPSPTADPLACADNRLSPEERADRNTYAAVLPKLLAEPKFNRPRTGTIYLQYEAQTPAYLEASGLLESPFSRSLARCLASGKLAPGVPRMELVKGFQDPALPKKRTAGFERATKGEMLTIYLDRSTPNGVDVKWQFTRQAMAVRQYSPAEYEQVLAAASGLARWGGADRWTGSGKTWTYLEELYPVYRIEARQMARGYAPVATVAPGTGPWPTSYPRIEAPYPSHGPAAGRAWPTPSRPSGSPSAVPRPSPGPSAPGPLSSPSPVCMRSACP